jgi:chromosome segregation ATPase
MMDDTRVPALVAQIDNLIGELGVYRAERDDYARRLAATDDAYRLLSIERDAARRDTEEAVAGWRRANANRDATRADQQPLRETIDCQAASIREMTEDRDKLVDAAHWLSCQKEDLTLEVDALRARLDRATAALRRWIEAEGTPCRYDDSDFCQEHDYCGPCVVEQARAALAEEPR